MSKTTNVCPSFDRVAARIAVHLPEPAQNDAVTAALSAASKTDRGAVAAVERVARAVDDVAKRHPGAAAEAARLSAQHAQGCLVRMSATGEVDPDLTGAIHCAALAWASVTDAVCRGGDATELPAVIARAESGGK